MGRTREQCRQEVEFSCRDWFQVGAWIVYLQYEAGRHSIFLPFYYSEKRVPFLPKASLPFVPSLLVVSRMFLLSYITTYICHNVLSLKNSHSPHSTSPSTSYLLCSLDFSGWFLFPPCGWNGTQSVINDRLLAVVPASFFLSASPRWAHPVPQL